MTDLYRTIGLQNKTDSVDAIKRAIEKVEEKNKDAAERARYILLDPERKITYDRIWLVADKISKIRGRLNTQESQSSMDSRNRSVFMNETVQTMDSLNWSNWCKSGDKVNGPSSRFGTNHNLSTASDSKDLNSVDWTARCIFLVALLLVMLLLALLRA